MSLVFILKLILVPALIAGVTLAGRRWGPAVAGWLSAFPVVAGPILLVMALALYIAVSTGQWDARTNPTPAEKKMSSISQKRSPDQKPRSSPEACAISLASSSTPCRSRPFGQAKLMDGEDITGGN